MRSRHIPMTMDEFNRLPRKLGWKYEYWEKCAHISPAHHVVTATIELTPRTINSPYTLRPVETGDEPRLVSLYIDAFKDTIEFCDWEPSKIAASAEEDIRGFYTGKRGKPLPASRVAVDAHSDASVIGAVLIVERNGDEHDFPPGGGGTLPYLDILFIAPHRQRRGAAAVLVSTAMDELYRSGHKRLKSHYHLGNEASRDWHRRFGFKDEVDHFLAERYYRHAQYELHRRELIGDLTETEHRLLVAKVEKWKHRADELEIIDRQHNRNLPPNF